MKVAGYLRPHLSGAGLMAQDDPGILGFLYHRAHSVRQPGCIVVAGNPHPVRGAGEGGQHARRMRFHSGKSRIIVEGIAQAIDPPCPGLPDCIGQLGQRFPAVVRRQHLTICGVKARLFKMQVRDQQNRPARTEQRAALRQQPVFTSERKGNHRLCLPDAPQLGKAACMDDWNAQTARAKTWFESLRDDICAAFEAIEREAGSDATFAYTPWNRETADGSEGGGGTRGVMKGQVFEKVGVNVSTVRGEFAPEFAKTINGADADARGFTATGISLVAHMANPHVPAVHMNTRFLTTSKAWFGGGADLNPPIPYDEDTRDFHTAFQQACDAHDPEHYPRFKKWADEYFYIPHRGVHRGVGGIFYDHLECTDAAEWERHFAFTRDVGSTFLAIFPDIVRRRMGMAFSAEEKQRQLEWRGRYAEFNLVYDRGTLFGLKTGGNIDAILMSLPPEAVWS